MSDPLLVLAAARKSVGCMKSLLKEGTERIGQLQLAMRLGKPDLIDDELEGLRTWEERVKTYIGLLPNEKE